MFIWRDAAGTSWNIDITFAGKGAPIHAVTKGERMHIGADRPGHVADSNKPPKLTAQQAASWAWTPDAGDLERDSGGLCCEAATVVITGYRDGACGLTRGRD